MIGPIDGSDNLARWLALEIRRSQSAFDNSRKQQDADFEAKGMRKTGIRVELTLRSASEICVALADATIAKAAEHRALPDDIAEARKTVLAFTKEVANSAIPLAHFVSGETGTGDQVVKVTIERGQQLWEDVAGAFDLAEMSNSEFTPQARDLRALLIILRDEGAYNWEKERDRINSEFAKKGRVQCTYHVKSLAESAGLLTSDLLDSVFALATPQRDYLTVKEFVSAVFAPLAAEITDIAIGKSGRTPQPDNADSAERWTDEARKRIDSKIALWKLGAAIKNVSQLSLRKPFVTKNKNSVGRPKGAGAFDDSSHIAEMHTLILQTPGLSPRDAAKILERKAAKPNADPESTIRRLVGKYNEANVAK